MLHLCMKVPKKVAKVSKSEEFPHTDHRSGRLLSVSFIFFLSPGKPDIYKLDEILLALMPKSS